METVVYVVTEHEPDNDDFLVMVKEVFASEALADSFVSQLEAARDEEGEKTSEHLWWEVSAELLYESMPEDAWVNECVIEL